MTVKTIVIEVALSHCCHWKTFETRPNIKDMFENETKPYWKFENGDMNKISYQYIDFKHMDLTSKFNFLSMSWLLEKTKKYEAMLSNIYIYQWKKNQSN